MSFRGSGAVDAIRTRDREKEFAADEDQHQRAGGRGRRGPVGDECCHSCRRDCAVCDDDGERREPRRSGRGCAPRDYRWRTRWTWKTWRSRRLGWRMRNERSAHQRVERLWSAQGFCPSRGRAHQRGGTWRLRRTRFEGWIYGFGVRISQALEEAAAHPAVTTSPMHLRQASSFSHSEFLGATSSV